MRNLFPMTDKTTLIGAGDSALSDLSNIISTINTVISAAIGIVTAGVVILAIFIAYKFFTAEDDGKRKNAKSQLIYAIIGIVVLLALMIVAPTITTAIGNALGSKS